jgi:LAGLIDADG DNA endonuclease family protein
MFVVRIAVDNPDVRSDAGPWFSREFLSAYISGYADGEGCFTVSIAPRSSLRLGWEVRPSFSVSQNGGRAEVLHAFQAYFGCGSIRPDRSDRTVKWETRRLDDLVEQVVPHFEVFPLLSGKQADFKLFASVCRLMAAGAHRNRQGLVEIVELARGMNPSGKRRYRAEVILASLRQGEGIVCASGNGGFTRSSDLHEWRNDLGAVSTRDPVKL